MPMGEECDASPLCGRPLSDLVRCPLRLGSKKLESDTLVSNVMVVTEASGQDDYVSWGKDMDPPRKGEPAWAIENLGNDFPGFDIHVGTKLQMTRGWSMKLK